jgi:hypothetical protein
MEDLTIRVQSGRGVTSPILIPLVIDLMSMLEPESESYPQSRFVQKLATSFKIAMNSRISSYTSDKEFILVTVLDSPFWIKCQGGKEVEKNCSPL